MHRTFLLAMAALLGSGVAHAESLSSNATAPSTNLPMSDTSMTALPSEARPMISQGDPAWRWIRFGNTTVGRAGCLLMSLYDVFSSLGITSTDPATFVRTLSANGFFTSSSKLRWNLGQLFPVWTDRLTISGAAALQKAKTAISNGTQVLFEVVTSRGTNHWVVVSRIVNGNAEIRDPNGGRIGWLSSLYGLNSVHGMVTVTAN